MLIRVSGAACDTLVQRIFKTGSKPEPFKHQHLHYGFIMDGTELLDEVLISFFKAPRSYTGEDMIEITCHASPYIGQRMLEVLCIEGARIAEPGEFTLRSYLNGKRDMAEAEAVGSILQAESAAQLRVAMAQLTGQFSAHIDELRSKLLHFTALLELELDFSEEDVTFANRDELEALCADIINEVEKLIDSYKVGKKIENGVKTSIVGVPNAGKSSLMNQLLGRDRAIVTHIAGTTRDVVSDTTIIDGLLYRLSDTAGLRETEDPIEQIGIERTHASLAEADVVLCVMDGSEQSINTLQEQWQQLPHALIGTTPHLVLLNKSDLLSEAARTAAHATLSGLTNSPIIDLSAKTGLGIAALKEALSQMHRHGSLSANAIVTNSRHLQALQNGHAALLRVSQQLSEGLSGDLVAIDLHSAIDALGEISGSTISSENVLHHIFENYCIGK